MFSIFNYFVCERNNVEVSIQLYNIEFRKLYIIYKMLHAETYQLTLHTSTN